MVIEQFLLEGGVGSRDVVSGAGALVAGGEDGTKHLTCVTAADAAHDVYPSGLAVLVVAFPAF